MTAAAKQLARGVLGIGVLVLGGGLGLVRYEHAAQARADSDALERANARLAAQRSRTSANTYTDCGLHNSGVSPVDIDGNPAHAKYVLWTQLDCDEGRITLVGRLPTLH